MKEIKGSPDKGVVYHEYECVQCKQEARNTYCEPDRTNMKDRKLCFTCNFWFDFAEHKYAKRFEMTIIDSHVYTPGNRTTGSYRGMAGRRFDIEYIGQSIYAGKKITTFDLWSGSTIPENIRSKFPDTAKFLGGAERHVMPGPIIEGCWNPSTEKCPPYPLPREAGIREIA